MRDVTSYQSLACGVTALWSRSLSSHSDVLDFTPSCDSKFRREAGKAAHATGNHFRAALTTDFICDVDRPSLTA
jgi:hypothetical protein